MNKNRARIVQYVFRTKKNLAEEEICWQQRGIEKWILQGDFNIAFFHFVANGRRKRVILHLEEGKVLEDREEIQGAIYSYYMELSGKQKERINYCFGWISGLKINYHKSEVYPMGLSKSEQNEDANMLDYKVGYLPMVYLGITVLINI